jgi:hypothetical protein
MVFRTVALHRMLPLQSSGINNPSFLFSGHCIIAIEFSFLVCFLSGFTSLFLLSATCITQLGEQLFKPYPHELLPHFPVHPPFLQTFP